MQITALFPSYLSHQSASETQNCDCLIGYCFTILNEVIFPRTPPSLIIYETNFTPKIFSNQTYWISCHHCELKTRPLYLSGLPTLCLFLTSAKNVGHSFSNTTWNNFVHFCRDLCIPLMQNNSALMPKFLLII